MPEGSFAAAAHHALVDPCLPQVAMSFQPLGKAGFDWVFKGAKFIRSRRGDLPKAERFILKFGIAAIEHEHKEMTIGR